MLETANIKLGDVASDVLGASGRALLQRVRTLIGSARELIAMGLPPALPPAYIGLRSSVSGTTEASMHDLPSLTMKHPARHSGIFSPGALTRCGERAPVNEGAGGSDGLIS